MPPPVRVLFCTSGGVHGKAALGPLLDSDHVHLVGIVHSTRVLRACYGPLRGAWTQVRISGLRYATYLGVAAAVDVTCGAGARDLPVLATRDINSPQGRSFIERASPEILVSAFFNQRIGESVIAIPRLGAVNIHPSLLPAYRGVDPVFYVRLRSLDSIGVTVHRITADFDAGPVIAQRAVRFAPTESILRVTARAFACGARLLLDHLNAIVAGASGIAQNGPGNYDSWPDATQVAALRRAGVQLVAWEDLRDMVVGRVPA